MSAFAGGTRAPVKNLSVKHDASTNSSTKRCVEDVVAAARRTPACFRQSRGVSVVVNSDRNRIRFLHFTRQRKISPTGEVRGIQNHAAVRIERPGCANADSPDRTAVLRKCLGNSRKDRA